MQVTVCEETHATIRFNEECPTCSNQCLSMIYTLDDNFLSEPEHEIHFNCPTDGPFSSSGALSFTWAPSE